MKCLICRKDTEGSVGAAGLKWRNLCQPCKDREDNMGLASLKALSTGVGLALKALEPAKKGVKQPQERPTDGRGMIVSRQTVADEFYVCIAAIRSGEKIVLRCPTRAAASVLAQVVSQTVAGMSDPEPNPEFPDSDSLVWRLADPDKRSDLVEVKGAANGIDALNAIEAGWSGGPRLDEDMAQVREELMAQPRRSDLEF